MEAVGRLAGGVAHDFNNLLQVITGSTLFARDGLPADSAARAELAEIDAAAARAAALTRQLLAFSRQQVLRPELASVNQVVSGVERMLRRLISADVTLVTDLEPDLAAVCADVGQLEQVLLNLVVNACDAMPDGGTLTIQTRAVHVDGSAASDGKELPPGAYVAVGVRDTGVGMDQSTRARLFEPFYTTKPLGKGTGLGLATVYGIVMQSGGHVQVDSAPGAGSTFTVLLPTADDVPVPDAAPRREPPPHGRETLLVVEDEPTVRGVVRRMLELGGYTVLEARDGAEALSILTTHSPAIDLVVSDIVMPQMSAGALLARLGDRARPPKVLLMSGYSRESVTQRPGIAQDVELLAKPFTPDALLRRVRAALDAPHAPARLTTA
jgi:CheY-like chemotaxis protein